jgi:two-component system cell cycle response regulator DivK
MGSRVLVVDDLRDNRVILRDALSSAGYEVSEAEDGPSALKKALLEMPDLILLDIQLPGIDGFEVAQRLKANDGLPHIPIVLVSSYALGDEEARARDSGCAYMPKPISPRRLVALVGGLLGAA